MASKIIVKNGKPNYFSLITVVILSFYAIRKLNDGQMVYGSIISIVALFAIIHTILSLTSPVLIHEEEVLILKPKIPFERKIIPIETIVEIKINPEKKMSILIKDRKPIPIDLGGHSTTEIQEARNYLNGLL